MATADDIRATIAAYPERMTAGDKDGWLALFEDVGVNPELRVSKRVF